MDLRLFFELLLSDQNWISKKSVFQDSEKHPYFQINTYSSLEFYIRFWMGVMVPIGSWNSAHTKGPWQIQCYGVLVQQQQYVFATSFPYLWACWQYTHCKQVTNGDSKANGQTSGTLEVSTFGVTGGEDGEDQLKCDQELHYQGMANWDLRVHLGNRRKLIFKHRPK